jgi:hypothetical protein
MRPPAGGRQYIYWYPFLYPPIPPQPTFNPSVCPVTTVERMDVEPNPKKNHPKNPSVKSMAPPAPCECNQLAGALHQKVTFHSVTGPHAPGQLEQFTEAHAGWQARALVAPCVSLFYVIGIGSRGSREHLEMPVYTRQLISDAGCADLPPQVLPDWVPQSASGDPGHGLSACSVPVPKCVTKTGNLGGALPGQDRMCQCGIIGVA